MAGSQGGPRSLLLQLGEVQLQLAQQRLAAEMADHEGWRAYKTMIEDQRRKHMEILAVDSGCDVAFERGVIATLSTFRAVLTPDKEARLRLEKRAGVLREELRRMQDAGLIPDTLKEQF